MPLYICTSRKAALDDLTKIKIANAITDTHCSVTGAPASFVHVVFFEESPRFALDENAIVVRGTIRKGRSHEQKDAIAASIKTSLIQLTNIEEQEVEAIIRETPASWVMEGGEIMPEPGEESAWFAAQEARRKGELL